jgi:hypothetical protein
MATLKPQDDDQRPPIAQPPANAPTLTRARIREENAKPRTDRVWIKQWGSYAVIRVMTGKQRDAYETEITGSRAPGKNGTRTLNLANIRARLVARCLIDGETGEPLYDWNKREDLEELGATDAAVLDTIFSAVSQLNGITEADIAELTKNLPAEANDDTGSN